jgi:hypothetical protein
VKISTGARTLLRKNTERVSGWVFDLDGNLRLATRTADNGDTEILRVDDSGFTKVYACSVFESCGPGRFHKDGKRVYLETNHGDPDLIQLMLFDPASGQTELVESDPLKRVDFGQAYFSEATDELVATTYEDERVRFYFKDPATGRLHGASPEAAGQGGRGGGRHRRRPALVRDRDQRQRPWRPLPVRPQDQGPHPPVQGARADPS